jgi:hypothetical protein
MLLQDVVAGRSFMLMAIEKYEVRYPILSSLGDPLAESHSPGLLGIQTRFTRARASVRAVSKSALLIDMDTFGCRVRIENLIARGHKIWPLLIDRDTFGCRVRIENLIVLMAIEKYEVRYPILSFAGRPAG